jgi:hypothetical protein
MRKMSHPAFLLLLDAGAALLAIWLLTRFPEWFPAHLRRAPWHFAFSLVCVWAAGNSIEPLAARGSLTAVAAVFLLVLPTLVYSWIVVATILRLFHEAAVR